MKKSLRFLLAFYVMFFLKSTSVSATEITSPAPDSLVHQMSDILANKYSIIDMHPQRAFYNNSIRISAGYSLSTLRLDNSMQSYNDTSEHKFSISGHSPILTWSQTFALDSNFSLGYRAGYSKSEIYFDQMKYGSDMFFATINPQLYLFRSYNFELYMNLKIGVSYERNNLDQVPDERIRNQFPTGFHMITGCTLAGVNYLLNDHIAMNAEFSLWSAESVSFGLSYRWFRPKKQKTYMDFNL